MDFVATLARLSSLFILVFLGEFDAVDKWIVVVSIYELNCIFR